MVYFRRLFWGVLLIKVQRLKLRQTFEMNQPSVCYSPAN
jgi:hypothetical protein